jgi:hypothetical protein
VRLPQPFVIKADGRGSRCVMFISRSNAKTITPVIVDFLNP